MAPPKHCVDHYDLPISMACTPRFLLLVTILRSQLKQAVHRLIKRADRLPEGITYAFDPPEEILQIIVGKLEADDGHNSFASVRQTSAAWLAALQNYPASAICRGSPPQHLEGLCKALPSMISLAIKPPQLDLDLRLVAMLRQLTSLTLSDHPNQSRPFSVDLSTLPGSLSELTLENINIHPITRDFQSSELTKLFWEFKPRKEEEDRSDGGSVLLLLICLQNLKVLIFKGCSLAKPQEALERMCSLPEEPPSAEGAASGKKYFLTPNATLERLELDLNVAAAWKINNLLRCAPKLVTFSLDIRTNDWHPDDNPSFHQHKGHLALPSSVRFLTLEKWCPLDIPKISLLSLRWSYALHGRDDGMSEAQRLMASLTTLTRLEIAHLTLYYVDWVAFPHLQELSLESTTFFLTSKLLDCFASPALRKLRLVDVDLPPFVPSVSQAIRLPGFNFGQHARQMEQRSQRLASLGMAFLRLPNLEEVSANSELFTGCTEELKRWHEVVYERPPRHPAVPYWVVYHGATPSKRWIKK